jgi:glyoxylase-like metal-dependent hydrolase (beta-lactamase superfamily II)
MNPLVEAFFEKRTSSVQYLVTDVATRQCLIIDPVLDYDENSGSLATRSADALLGTIQAQGCELAWILDTHPHADHLSAAAYLKDKTGALTAIGEKITEVQAMWKDIYGLPASFPDDGSQWDRLLADDEILQVGGLPVKVMLTGPHSCVCHLSHRRRGLHPRHSLYAGCRHRARRLSRRKRQGVMAQHPAAS